VELTEANQDDQAVYQFIYEQIDSVPHLEALLLLWNARPQPWLVENLATRLYVSVEVGRSLLQDLARRQLIVAAAKDENLFSYESTSVERDQLMAEVDAVYRREVVRVSTLIHSKPSSSVQEFARAFRFIREKR
jgi:hypothetical protein